MGGVVSFTGTETEKKGEEFEREEEVCRGRPRKRQESRDGLRVCECVCTGEDFPFAGQHRVSIPLCRPGLKTTVYPALD